MSVVLLLVVATASIVAAKPADAAVETTLYVSPSGSGSACSSSSPCGLAAAQSQVEALAPTMTGDIIVQLAGGTYAFTSPWTLTGADSGTGGHEVVFDAAPNSVPLLNGGTQITGWTLHDSSKNIYQASIPSGFATRQLYVNGLRASLATGSVSQIFGTLTQTPTGYTYSASGPNSWANTSATDFVYAGPAASSAPWTDSVCSASTIASGVVTMASGCYSNGVYSSTYPDPALQIPTAVENNYALLNTPGQFSYDTSANVISYIPRPGENLSTATVMASNMPTILNMSGTSTSPVSNVTISGLSFAYSGLLLGANGLLNEQANVYFGSSRAATLSMAAAVECHSCHSVTFSNNILSHLGDSGLSFDTSGSNNSITANSITDASGSGIQIGDPSESSVLESGDSVTDNYIFGIGVDYWGSIGIWAGWVKSTVIQYNEIGDVPYSGISVGWGWGTGSGSMNDNHIDYNYVHDVMTTSLADGAAIYVNGLQGSSPASSITYNYIDQDSQRGAALYLDNGASYWTVRHNVVGGSEPCLSLVQAVYGGGALQATNDDVEYNSTTSACESASSVPSSDTVQNNNLSVATWSSSDLSVISGAGLQPADTAVRSGPSQTDIAYSGTASASSEYSSSYGPANGIDETTSLFASAGSDSAPYWQVDLGGSHQISDIQILFRQDGYDYPSDRSNLTVLVSSTPSLTSGAYAICTLGSQAIPLEGKLDCPLPANSWLFRYVSIENNLEQPLAFSEVRVFGSTDSNVAAGAYTYESSQYSSYYPSSNAVDSDPTTLYASAVNGTDQWIEADLGSAKTLSEAQIVFRDDGVDRSAERENIQVWVSNYADMSSGHTVACNLGSTPLPYASTYTCSLPPGPWRYVASIKQDTTELVIAELRIF